MFKDSRTNWKYILIVVVLAGIVGVGILYQWRLLKEEAKISEIEILEKITEVPEGTEKQLTLDAIKNTEYHCLIYNKTIKLIDGSYTEKYGFETATVLSIRIYDDKIAFGDLDNDKKEDAAVILTSSGGGTGNFRELAIILNKDGEPSYLASKELGDRVIINSITIELGTIILDMIVHGPEDGLCCPSVEKVFKYKLSENQLIEIAEDETADWKTYKNGEYGFEIKYPRDWVVESPDKVHVIFYPLSFKEEFEHPFIGITKKPNPQKLSIREFYNGVHERDLFFQSGDKYTTGKIMGRDYFKFSPYITFAGETIVVIPLDSAFVEIYDFGDAFQESGIFDKMLSTFKFLE